MNKNFTYNINEEFLRQRFSEYEVNLDEKNWEELERNLDEVKVQAAISLKKIKPRIILIPLFIGITAIALYFSVDKLSGSTADSASSLPVQSSAPEQKINPPAAQKEIIIITTGPVKNNTVSTPKKTEQPTEKQSLVVVAPPLNKEPLKPESSKVAENAVIINTGTAPGEKAGVTDAQDRKKKKRKRNNGAYDAIETIRTSSLIPSSDDDDVVVPSN